MLVRKYVCLNCGANRVNEITNSFIYCDYCSELIGYDLDILKEEATSAYDMEYFMKHQKHPPAMQQYLDTALAVSEAMHSRDIPLFTEKLIDLRKAQFQLYPGMVSPKMKNPAYQKKYFDFLKMFVQEDIENGYFERQSEFNGKVRELSGKMKYVIKDGRTLYEYNDDFLAYFRYILDYSKESADRIKNYRCAAESPEKNIDAQTEVMYKQSVIAYSSMLDEESYTKLLKEFGLDIQFIEVPEVDFSDTSCVVCESKLHVPEGSTKMVCETCGNVNAVGTGEITCVNCGAGFSPGEEKSCPYCGSVYGV